MQPLVDLAVISSTKGFRAILADKVLDFQVNHFDVLGHALLTGGCMIALITLELLFLCVSQHVLVQLLFCGPAHTAMRTNKVSDPGVAQKMISKFGVHSIAFLANVTAEGQLLSSVIIHMFLQCHWATEYFIAFWTWMYNGVPFLCGVLNQ